MVPIITMTSPATDEIRIFIAPVTSPEGWAVSEIETDRGEIVRENLTTGFATEEAAEEAAYEMADRLEDQNWS